MTESFDISVRKAAISDLAEIAEIENATSASPWSSDSLRCDIEDEEKAFIRVAENRTDATSGTDALDAASAGTEAASQICGYLDAWIVAGEATLNNIAVRKTERRSGIGSALMSDFVDGMKGKGVSEISLEVRKSNDPAINLYKKYGFSVCGERKKYYLDNGEDALIMVLKFRETGNDQDIGNNSDIGND